MNGVLHSEHVISRSGIRGFSTKVKTRTFTFLLFGALALRFFQPPGCGAKARFLFLQTHAEKLASRRLVGLSVLQQCTLFNFFVQTFDKNCGRTSSQVRAVCGVRATTHNRSISKIRIFTGHIGCSSFVFSTWYLVLCSKCKVQRTKTID